MSLLVLLLLIQSSNYTIIRQMKPVLVGTHGVFSESHNWDVMVRGCSLIDPCWSALNRSLNGRLRAERESTASTKWQQLLCWSCCQRELRDGDVLLTLFWNKNLTIAPDNERRRLAPNRSLWSGVARRCQQRNAGPAVLQDSGQADTETRGGVHLALRQKEPAAPRELSPHLSQCLSSWKNKEDSLVQAGQSLTLAS